MSSFAEFESALLAYVKRVKALHEKVKGNEQAAKMSLIGPLFTLLGYDLTDPQEAKDAGTKLGGYDEQLGD